MTTRETDYALRVVLYLSRQSLSGTPTASTSDLAAQMDIPYRFLRKIVRRLVDARLLHSQRGKGGGVELARPPRRISFMDVIAAIDPSSVHLNRCLLHRLACNRSRHCAIHNELHQIQRILDRRLKAIRFDRVAAAAE